MFGSTFATAAGAASAAGAAAAGGGGADGARTGDSTNSQDPVNVLNNMFAGMNTTTVSCTLFAWYVYNCCSWMCLPLVCVDLDQEFLKESRGGGGNVSVKTESKSTKVVFTAWLKREHQNSKKKKKKTKQTEITPKSTILSKME